MAATAAKPSAAKSSRFAGSTTLNASVAASPVFGWSSGQKNVSHGPCNETGKTQGLLKMILCNPIPQRFDRCALVGGSADLNGRHLGPEIDAHDTVIRVNRVPNEVYKADFGNRTDILFAGPVAEKRPMFTWLGMFYRQMGGEYEMCKFRSDSCPFGTLIFKGADRREFGKPWEARYPLENPGWTPRTSKWPLAHQEDRVNDFAYDLIGGKRPTNGFQAFLTFLLLCDTLDVYGFSGTGTADGHWMSKHHNLTLEHDLQRQLMDGSFVDSPSVNVSRLDPELLRRVQEKAGKVNILVTE